MEFTTPTGHEPPYWPVGVVNSIMDEVKVLPHPSIPQSVISAHEVVTAGPDPVVPTVAASRGTKRARRGV